MRTRLAVVALLLALGVAHPAGAGVGVGDPMPDLAGVDLSGTRTTLAALGRRDRSATAVVAWATWCGAACDQPAAKLAALAKDRPWLRLVIVVPAEGDTADAARAGLATLRLTSPVLLVDDGVLDQLTGDLPLLVMFDAKGVVRWWQTNNPDPAGWTVAQRTIDSFAPAGWTAPVAAVAPRPTVPVACSKRFLDRQVAKGQVTALDLRRVALELAADPAAPAAPAAPAGKADDHYDDGRRPVLDHLKRQVAVLDLYQRADKQAQVDLGPGDLLVYRLPWQRAGAVMVVRAFDRATGVGKVVLYNEQALIGASPAEPDPDGKDGPVDGKPGAPLVRTFPGHLGGRVANEVYSANRELLIVYRGANDNSYVRPGLLQLRPTTKAICK